MGWYVVAGVVCFWIGLKEVFRFMARLVERGDGQRKPDIHFHHHEHIHTPDPPPALPPAENNPTPTPSCPRLRLDECGNVLELDDELEPLKTRKALPR
jgi:hypothetical protein